MVAREGRMAAVEWRRPGLAELFTMSRDSDSAETFRLIVRGTATLNSTCIASLFFLPLPHIVIINGTATIMSLGHELA